MRPLAVIVLGCLVGCGSAARAPAVIEHRERGAPTAASAAPVPQPLPCGVSAIEELAAHDDIRVGTCEILHEGDYVTLVEDGRPVMRSGDGKPTVVFDARLPGPAGIRVGDDVARIQERAGDRRVIECHRFDDDVLQCELRATAEPPDCTDPTYGDVLHLRFAAPAGLAVGTDLEGDAAWRAIALQRATAVLLDMPC